MNQTGYRTSIFATIIGNCMEWFDYALIGYIAPRYINIYPLETASINPLFFIYCASLIGRPFGGLLFGYLGDVLGRRLILILSIALISTGALFTAILPSLFNFSLLTPMFLLLILLVHNLSAGGETPGTITYLYESFPKHLRPFALSWVNFGFFLGVFLSTVDFSSLFWELRIDQFLDWGWRLPFLFSACIGFLGLSFRKKLHESPQFQLTKNQHQLAKNPFKLLFRDYKKEFVLGTGMLMLHIVAINIIVVFGPSYFQTYLKRSADETLTLSIFSMMIGLLSTAFAGYLSLKFKARNILKFIAVVIALGTLPLYMLMQLKSIVPLFFANACLVMICSIYSALMPSFVCDLFPTQLRCSGYSACRNLLIAVIPGIILLVLSWLIVSKAMLFSPAWAIIIGALISLASLVVSEKTKHIEIKKAH